MEKVFIYTLEHPITHEIRYVGKTKNPKMRFHNHCNKAHNIKSHKANWIKYLRSQNLKPIMRIIDEVEEKDWHFWEKYWIQQLNIWGIKLTNHTSGGEGLTMGNETSFKKGNKAFNDTDTFISCKQCNISFKVSPSSLKYNKSFCSLSCYAEYKKGKPFINKGSFSIGHIPSNKGKKYFLEGKKKANPVLQYTLENIFIKEFRSTVEASKEVNCIPEAIRLVCVGKNKRTKGFIWKYKNQK